MNMTFNFKKVEEMAEGQSIDFLITISVPAHTDGPSTTAWKGEVKMFIIHNRAATYEVNLKFTLRS